MNEFTVEKLQEQTRVLRELIPKLRAGTIGLIEYGDPEHPGGFLSHHRVRKYGNAVGFKVIHLGMESGGLYFDMSDEAAIQRQSQKLLECFHRPFIEQAESRAMKIAPLPSTLTYFGI